MAIRNDVNGKRVITMRVLDAAAVGALEDPPVRAATIRKRLQRYPASHDNAYPPPLPDKVNGGYVWREEDVPKLRAWKGAGSGKGGGRPRRNPVAGPETHAAGSGPMSSTADLDPMHREILGRLIESGRQLGNIAHAEVSAGRWYPVSDPTTGQPFARSVYPHSTLKAMERRGLVKLGRGTQDMIGIRNRDRSYTRATITPQGVAAFEASAPVAEPASPVADDLADRPLSHDPADAGKGIWQLIGEHNARARQDRARLKTEARKRVTGDQNAPDHADIRVDVVEPGKAIVVGPGFQARVGVNESAKSRLYWVELSESDSRPGDAEKHIGTVRTYAAAGELLARYHGLTTYTVAVDYETKERQA